MTRAETALGCETSVRSVDRARFTDPPLLKWHHWNSDRVRIWSQDARAWYRKNCPTKILLTLVLLIFVGYGLLNAGCALGIKSAQDAMKWMNTPHLPYCAAHRGHRKRHSKHARLYALDDRKAPRQVVRWGTKKWR